LINNGKIMDYNKRQLSMCSIGFKSKNCKDEIYKYLNNKDIQI